MFTTGTVTSSGIVKVYVFCPIFAADIKARPFFRVTVTGALVCPVKSTRKDTDALAACLDLGTYPIFLAKETTFSLKVALSILTLTLSMLTCLAMKFLLIVLL